MLLDRSRKNPNPPSLGNCLRLVERAHGQGWQAEELLRAEIKRRETRFSPGRGQKVPLDKTLSSFRFPHLMTDPRYKKLAKLLVEYSTRLKIRRPDHARYDRRARRIHDRIDARQPRGGRHPHCRSQAYTHQPEIVRDTDQAHAKLVSEVELFRMKKMQAYIAIRGSSNANENAEVPSNRMALYSKLMRPVLNHA